MRALAICSMLVLTGCNAIGYKSYYQRKGITLPQGNEITHCYHYGCKDQQRVAISDPLRAELSTLFTTPSKNAKEERTRIAKAIQAFEIHIGAAVGTEADKAGTFKHMGRYQLDCIDESVNTTSYLIYLKQKGYMPFHRIGSPQSRLPLFAGRWPHQTAAIYDMSTQKGYAVDSWFHDNGQPPEIVPLDIWRKGWKPGAI